MSYIPNGFSIREFHVGDGPYSYTTIQKAIDAINAASPSRLG